MVAIIAGFRDRRELDLLKSVRVLEYRLKTIPKSSVYGERINNVTGHVIQQLAVLIVTTFLGKPDTDILTRTIGGASLIHETGSNDAIL